MARLDTWTQLAKTLQQEWKQANKDASSQKKKQPFPTWNLCNHLDQLIVSHGWGADTPQDVFVYELLHQPDTFFSSERMPSSWKQTKTWSAAMESLEYFFKDPRVITNTAPDNSLSQVCQSYKLKWANEYRKGLRKQAKESSQHQQEASPTPPDPETCTHEADKVEDDSNLDDDESHINNDEQEMYVQSEEMSLRDMGLHMLYTYIEAETDPIKKLYLTHVYTFVKQ